VIRALPISLALSLSLAGATAGAQHTLELLEENGPTDNRIDLVVMGDGYTADQQDELADDTTAALEAVFEKNTYAEYRPFFNLARISTISPASGADHPDESEFVDTFFHCAYDCAGLDRLICCDYELITAVAAELYPTFDFILLVVNDPEYGGSGGLVAITSSSPLAYQVPPHEFGHTLGLLGDEYDDPFPAWECEDIFPNVSPTYDSDELKWAYWVEDGTPLPTPESAATDELEPVGAYEGACYEPEGWYRPVWSCLMRNLDSEFCSVCAEAMVLSFYGFVEPVDSYEPAVESITVDHLGEVQFWIDAVEPLSETLAYVWTVDGEELAVLSQGAYDLDAAELEVGEHLVEVTVRDETEMIRSDPEGLAEQTISWTVTRLPSSTDGSPDWDASADGASLRAVSPGGCSCGPTGSREPGSTGPIAVLLRNLFV
jgi:hypothetical protein